MDDGITFKADQDGGSEALVDLDHESMRRVQTGSFEEVEALPDFGAKVAAILNGTVTAIEREHRKLLELYDLEVRTKFASEGEPDIRSNNDLLIGHENSANTNSSPVEYSSIRSPTSRQINVNSTMHPRRTKTGIGFRLLPEWLEASEDSADLDDAQMAQLKYSATLTLLLDKPALAPRISPAMSASWFMARPTNRVRILWDLLGALLLTYDLCIIPMSVFDLPAEGFIFIMSVIIMLFWTLDIVGNFFVGYHTPEGDVELRARKVVRKYCMRWFVPDVLLVAADWITYGPQLFTGNSSESAMHSSGIFRMAKMARFTRLLRLLRLVRFGRLQSFFVRCQDAVGFESTAICLSLSKNLILIIFINHVIACGWYGVGFRERHKGWLADHADSTWLDYYLLALFWSLANFTPGMSGISPITRTEFIYTIFVLFFSLVAFTVLVSSTTSLISRLMGIQSSQKKQLWMLKGFLVQHKFSHELRDRVFRYVKLALGGRRDLIQKDEVQLLDLLSQPLREEVQLSLHLTTLRVHPLFRMLSVGSKALMRKLSVEALTEVALSRGDIIFSVGEVTDKMGFVVSGVLNYTAVVGSSNQGPSSSSAKLLGPEDQYCEAALWTRWHCRGTMQADADCDLLELSGAAFRKNVKKQALLSAVILDYAHAFLDVLNMAAAGGSDMELSDLQANYADGGPLQKFLSASGLHSSYKHPSSRGTAST